MELFSSSLTVLKLKLNLASGILIQQNNNFFEPTKQKLDRLLLNCSAYTLKLD